MLIGPWNHSRPNVAVPGPRIDYIAEVVRWCNYWLKDEDNGVMDEAPIDVYVQSYDEPHADRIDTSGYWRVEHELAPEGSELVSYLLVGETASDGYDYRPTVGIAGGLWSGGGAVRSAIGPARR